MGADVLTGSLEEEEGGGVLLAWLLESLAPAVPDGDFLSLIYP